MKRSLTIGLCAMILAMFATTAKAQLTLGFQSITNNDPTDVAIGEAQLFVDVSDAGSNQVLFTFRNIGPASSSIEQVYFDDGSLFSIANLIDFDDGIGGDINVDFSLNNVSPPDLPGGDSISPIFDVTTGFLADADPSGQTTVSMPGVGPAESLGIIFDLQAGKTFTDILDDLNTGALRIGIHVQRFDGDGSESFINNGENGIIIPSPSAILLTSIGIGITGFFRTRRFL